MGSRTGIDGEVRMARIEKARARMRDARRDLGHAVRQNLPAGTEVKYERGRRLVQVTVLDHSFLAGRVLVKNHATGNVYWITTFAIKCIVT